MQPNMERRVLVYQCGTRSVVNLSETRTCSSPSRSRCLPSESSTTCQGSRPREAAGFLGNTTTAAAERSALDSLCSTLTVNTVTDPRDAWWVDGVLSQTALSPSPRLPPPPPPPPPPARCTSSHGVNDTIGKPKSARAEALSKRCPHQSLQGMSLSPFVDDVHSCGDSAALPESDCHFSSFAEWPPVAVVASSSPVLLSCDQVGTQASVRCAAAGVVPGEWMSGVGTDDHETMHGFTQPPLELATSFQTGKVESAAYTDPALSASSECSDTVSALREYSRMGPLSHLLTSNADRGIVPIVATGAERVLFGEDDDFMDLSTASPSCCIPQPELQTTRAALCAAVDAVAHTPPRPRDVRPSALLASNHDGTGGCESTDCSSHEHFSVHYAATSVSSYTTPSESGLSAAAPVGSTGESLDAKLPGDCTPVKEGLTPKVIKDDAGALLAVAKDDQTEGTPCASTAVAGASGSLSALKTPMPSPLRQELFLRLLNDHTVSAAHTPAAHTGSSTSSLPNAGILATPTPLHRPHRWRGASATPGCESVALITGFPTPVKLSPIPTKGFSVYPDLAASDAVATADTILTSTPRASVSSSPAVSAIQGEAYECDGDEDDAVTPDAVMDQLVMTKNACAARRQSTSLWASVGGGVPPYSDGNMADYLSCGHSMSSISSECSVSQICVGARQTTRVWTPHSSEVSQQQQLTQPPSSCIDGHSSRLLNSFPSSTAVPPQPPPPQPISLYSSTTLGTPSTFPCDHTFSAHLNRSRTALRSERAAEEVSGDSTAISAIFREVQAQPLHQPPQNLSSSDVLTGGLALMHSSTDRSISGRAMPSYVADTLSLGIPTVPTTQSPAQSFGDSCYSPFMPPPTQYIQALTIPGLGRRNLPLAHAAQRADLAVESSEGDTGGTAFICGAQRSGRQETKQPALMSPVLNDNEERKTSPCSTAVPSSVKLPVLPLLVTSPVSSNPTQFFDVQQLRFPNLEETQCDAIHDRRAFRSAFLQSHSFHKEPGRLNRSVLPASPCASSISSQLRRSSSSKLSAASPQGFWQPHPGLSSTKDASCNGEVSHAHYHSTFTGTSHSSTYFIDSWL
nr:unnamed protein product [Leishmania braziliensis]